MPRIRTLDPADSEGTNRELFQQFLNERGNVPNMMRTVGHRPEHLRSLVDHFRVVMKAGTVPPLLKELIALRVSTINQCAYEIASHTALARGLGATAEQIEALEHPAPATWPSFPADCLGTAPTEPPSSSAGQNAPFDSAQRAALRFAEEMTRGTGRVSDEAFLALREIFEPAEVVEIALVTALFNGFNRFNNALEVEITR